MEIHPGINAHVENHSYYAKKYYTEKNYGMSCYHLTEVHGVSVRSDSVFKSNPCPFSKSEKLNLDRDLLKFYDNMDLEQFWSKLGEMPSEWTIVQVTRMTNHFDNFCPSTSYHKVNDFFLSRLSCGSEFKKTCLRVKYFEWPSKILSDPLETLYALRKEFEEPKKQHQRYIQRKKTSDKFQAYIEGLMSAFAEFTVWFNGRLCEKELENSIRTRIDNAIKENGINLDVGECYEAYLLAEGSTMLTDDQIKDGCRRLVKSNFSEVLKEEVLKIKTSFETQLSNAKRHPVILITDEFFDDIPWECTDVLMAQAVSRIASIHLLYALFRFHKPFIHSGLRLIDSDDVGFYVIDPDSNLQLEKLNSFFRMRLPNWEGKYKEEPDINILVRKLTSVSYMYCGHGSGSHLLKCKVNIQTLDIKKVQMLFGCRSSCYTHSGGSIPGFCSALEYLLAGSCCVIGFLSNVLTGDADRMTVYIINKWFPGEQIDFTSNKIIQGEQEKELLRILPDARNSSELYGNACALVARGIPVKFM